MSEEANKAERTSWGFDFQFKARVKKSSKEQNDSERPVLPKQVKPDPNIKLSEISQKIGMKSSSHIQPEEKIEAVASKKSRPNFDKFFAKHNSSTPSTTPQQATQNQLDSKPTEQIANSPITQPPPKAPENQRKSSSTAVGLNSSGVIESSRKSIAVFSASSGRSKSLTPNERVEKMIDQAVRSISTKKIEIGEVESYIYQKTSADSKELFKIVGKKDAICFESFVRIFHHFLNHELASIRSQGFVKSPTVSQIIEQLSTLINDAFAARMIQAESEDQVHIQRANMKNLLNFERLELIENLTEMFEKALESLDRFENIFGKESTHLSQEKNCANLKFKLFKTLAHAKKMSRNLSATAPITSEFEEARKSSIRPKAKAFHESAAKLEESLQNSSKLFDMIEAAEQRNAENAEILVKRTVDPFLEIIEMPAIDAIRLFLK